MATASRIRRRRKKKRLADCANVLKTLRISKRSASVVSVSNRGLERKGWPPWWWGLISPPLGGDTASSTQIHTQERMNTFTWGTKWVQCYIQLGCAKNPGVLYSVLDIVKSILKSAPTFYGSCYPCKLSNVSRKEKLKPTSKNSTCITC